MKIGLGMDTGGTYTDAVIMNLDSGEILDKTKAMTTREDLCIGIRNAIKSLDPEYVKQVNIVTLSSTLATNSVVEGKGCRVGLVCIGGDYNFDVPADYSIKVASEKQFSPSDSVEFQTNIYTDIQRRRAIENRHFDELLEKIREIKKEFITNEEKAQKIRELQ